MIKTRSISKSLVHDTAFIQIQNQNFKYKNPN